MFHMVAYFVSISTTPNTGLNAVTDAVMSIQNNHIIPQEDIELLAAYIASTTINRGRIRTPKMTNVAPMQIRPPMRTIVGVTDPNYDDLTKSTFMLRRTEEIIVEGTSDIAMGNENCYAGLWLGDGITPVSSGDLYCIRATGTTTCVASTWTICPLTFDDTLGAGLYEIVGAEAVSVSGVFFRILLNNQLWRPGGLAVGTIGLRGPSIQRDGSLGSWGTFRSTALPTLEMLCNAADTAQTVFFWIRKISDN